MPTATALGMHFADAAPVQEPAAVAVVMPTTLRPSLQDAVASIFRQDLGQRIQVLVGVDVARGDPAGLVQLANQRPSHVSVTVLHLPWSTSVRHGGLHSATDGGSLRAMLSLMANARHVAYLDDDNTWNPDHLSSLLPAIQGRAWAHTLRMLVDADSGADLGIDRWDSVGLDAGRFAAAGGFVDPNCLMVDKIACSHALARWAETADGSPGVTADRNVFKAIRSLPHARVDRATVRYAIRKTNILHRFLGAAA